MTNKAAEFVFLLIDVVKLCWMNAHLAFSHTALLIMHCRDVDFGSSTLNLWDRGREVVTCLHFTFSFSVLINLLYVFSPTLFCQTTVLL